MADQLKYFDPVFERMLYETSGDDSSAPTNAMSLEDQPWLQELFVILNQTNVIYQNFTLVI